MSVATTIATSTTTQRGGERGVERGGMVRCHCCLLLNLFGPPKFGKV